MVKGVSAFYFFVSFSLLAASGCLNAFDGPLIPFFEKHCYDCHDDSTTKGGLDLVALEGDLESEALFAKWERIYDRVAKGEMPPEKKPRPDDKELAQFRKDLAIPLAKAHEKSKGTVLRRLNRQEYANTVNDIFGTKTDLVSLLPEDGRSHEFDNIGSALGVSMIQLERYLEGIDQVLDEAIATTVDAPDVTTLKADYVSAREGQTHIPKAWGKAPDGAVLFFRQIVYPSGMLRGTGVREDGYYKIRVTGYAHRTEDPITFSIGGTSFARGSTKKTYGYYSFNPGEPQTIEITQLVRRNYMVEIIPFGLKDEDGYIQSKKTTEGYLGPGLAINHVEVEGPVFDQFPTKGHQLLFEGIDREQSNPGNKWKAEFRINSEDPRADAAAALLRVANRAFRRPVSSEEITPYVELFGKTFSDTGDFEEALRAGVTAIFLSPDFLYLKERPGFLDSYALAARLSYAFNRTLPDDELLASARTQKLIKDPNELWTQTQRLMVGEKFQRFIVDFADAWLNLREIEFTAPDGNLFPEYDRFLQYSIIEETRSYLRELIETNLPARNIVKSEFAMLNSRLGEHYGIEGVAGPHLRKFPLPPGSPRGGFLSQGSILKVSANGTNTSPVVRGVWVMERILGQTPAPPPPGIPGVEPDIRGATTLRELLDKHRDSESCQSCHRAIDPPGFAMESFNPIGGWRDHFRSLGEGERVTLEVNGRRVRYKKGPPVDSSGLLEGSGEFSGFNEFRDLLAEDEDRLAKAFVSKFLTFATGREMGFSDRPKINKIVAESAQNGHGIKDLIKLAIFSDIFRRK